MVFHSPSWNQGEIMPLQKKPEELTVAKTEDFTAPGESFSDLLGICLYLMH